MQNNNNMTDTISSTYCVLPWAHLYTGPDGIISPCCVGKELGKYQETTLKETWNTAKMKQLRLDMLSGVRNDICSVCYDHEDNGFKSMRQAFINDMTDVTENVTAMTNPDGSLSDFKLYYLDLRFNNLCNFKCRSCGPKFSSSIAVELIKNPNLNIENNPVTGGFNQNQGLISEIEKHYPYIKSIYFAGGEPMMQEEHWNILQHFTETDTAKNVSLIYSTNTSKISYKNNSVFDYWKHFKAVHVQMSIDAEGKRAEYWRDGTDWETVYNNIKLISSSGAYYTVHSVISWMNIYSYIELVKKLLEEKIVPADKFTIWCLADTKTIEFSLHILPEFKKEEISLALDDFILYLQKSSYPKIEHIIKNIENIKTFMFAKSIPITNETFRKNNMLDTIRNKDFFEYFTEHENMREYIK
jgi:MoaA/NifB/PqqE/SkfB family radical SAM enzyme